MPKHIYSLLAKLLLVQVDPRRQRQQFKTQTKEYFFFFKMGNGNKMFQFWQNKDLVKRKSQIGRQTKTSDMWPKRRITLLNVIKQTLTPGFRHLKNVLFSFHSLFFYSDLMAPESLSLCTQP